MPVPANHDRAARLFETAISRYYVKQLESQLADCRYREAKLHAKVCNMKAKQAAANLQAAEIYVSRVVYVINQGGFQQVLSLQPNPALF